MDGTSIFGLGGFCGAKYSGENRPCGRVYVCRRRKTLNFLRSWVSQWLRPAKERLKNALSWLGAMPRRKAFFFKEKGFRSECPGEPCRWSRVRWASLAAMEDLKWSGLDDCSVGASVDRAFREVEPAVRRRARLPLQGGEGTFLHSVGILILFFYFFFF